MSGVPTDPNDPVNIFGRAWVRSVIEENKDMTPAKPVPLSEEECASLHAELTDWEQDGFVAKAANNVTKVWAGRAKRCASIFKNLLTTITALRAQLEEAQRERDALKDDPEFDSTDFAHPAWWRGEQRGSDGTCEVMLRALTEDRHTGRFSSAKMNELREGIWSLRARAQAAENALKRIDRSIGDEHKLREIARAALQEPKP